MRILRLYWIVSFIAGANTCIFYQNHGKGSLRPTCVHCRASSQLQSRHPDGCYDKRHRHDAVVQPQPSGIRLNPAQRNDNLIQRSIAANMRTPRLYSCFGSSYTGGYRRDESSLPALPARAETAWRRRRSQHQLLFYADIDGLRQNALTASLQRFGSYPPQLANRWPNAFDVAARNISTKTVAEQIMVAGWSRIVDGRFISLISSSLE